jgi:thiosulfate reductase cytochrome b subunit
MRAFGIALATALLATGVARATPRGGVLLYRGGGQGRVVYDGRIHAKAGLRCNDCHSGLFPTRKTGLIARADHDRGTACFGCHDGRRAFADCERCHSAANR